MMKHFLAFLMLIASAFGASAAVINGIALDASDSTSLIQASVQLLRADQKETFVKGTTTDANGVFNLTDVSPGKYLLRVSYVGYTAVTKRLSVESTGRNVNMGIITLSAEGKMLNELVVRGVKTPITVKEDTIEYNADTYKTQPNAVVEDLLKRMPGVEVGSDGKITANGKSVTKILIDGKEFFGDDPTVASKNIPADMINKLQVIDRKSDLARLTGVDDGEDETVINLTVKKGMNNGWFGTVTGGYGTDNRYGGNVMANYFSNGNQFTFIAGGNNTNNLGFTDGGASRFRRFMGDRGITESQQLGMNFNIGSQDSEKWRLGGNIMYSHSDRNEVSSTTRQYIFPDSVSYYNAGSRARNRSHNITGDFRFKWEIGSLNTFEFRPEFEVNVTRGFQNDSSATRAGDIARSLVNQSINQSTDRGTGYDLEGQLVWNKKMRSRPGRALSLQMRYRYSNTDESGTDLTRNTFFRNVDASEYADRTSDQLSRSNGIDGRITWTEPLGNVANARFLTLAYRGNYRVSTADKEVYDLVTDPTTGLTDEVFNSTLSNNFRNRYYDQRFEVGIRQVRKKYNLNLGLGLTSAMSESENLLDQSRTIPTRWVWALAPFARFRYRFSTTRNLSFDYRARSSQPSLTQLQPVADVSNPLNVLIGNPALKPTFTHRINLRFSDFDQKAQRSIMAMVDANVEQNSIVSATTYDATTGGRTTTYRNAGGVWNLMAGTMLSVPLGTNKVWFFTNNLFTRLARTKGFNNDVANTNTSWFIALLPGLAYRTSLVDIELRPRYNFQTAYNTTTTAQNRNVSTYGAMLEATYTSPFGLVLSSDLNYSQTSGYSAGYNTTQWIWNASLSYQFLRNRSASIGITVNDILGQMKSVNRNVTANYWEDVAYNSLGRYGMLTFTYRFSTFAKGQEPTMRNDGPDSWRRGSGGPGGPGGRPPGHP